MSGQSRSKDLKFFIMKMLVHQVFLFFSITAIMFKRIFTFYLRVDFIFNLTPYKKQHDDLIKILHDFTDNVIINRREELMKMKTDSNESGNDHEDIGAKKKMAFLDVLLHSSIDGKPLSNLDIREEVDTFMFEGFVCI